MIKGPIIIIEDDEDDRLFIEQAIAKCNVSNPTRFFENGKQALQYLIETSERPFIIFCDINMPVMNGLQLRREINASDYLRNKSIPFVFLTTTDNRQQIIEAYELTVQGFFKKSNTAEELRETIREILQYWTKCLHPNAAG